MGVYLNPGNDNFEMICRSEIYVDKTELIKQTNQMIGTQQRFICISRPRLSDGTLWEGKTAL